MNKQKPAPKVKPMSFVEYLEEGELLKEAQCQFMQIIAKEHNINYRAKLKSEQYFENIAAIRKDIENARKGKSND